jgi:murein DD-endopeptidase / murein LD-carboxypeptidase
MQPDLAARALVGVRFRPQGRSPELGLDCVGLVLCAFALPDDLVRRDYRMRGDHGREMLAALARPFRRIARTRRRAGDVLLLKIAKDQFHLAILTITGFVHADARRGKVVESPAMPAWPVVAVFRRRVRKQGSF